MFTAMRACILGAKRASLMTEQTILIVDDEEKIRTLLRNVLEGEGFGVVTAASATQARPYIADAHLSLITLDVHLGSESGLELAREIRRTSDIPIIMVSGKDDVIDRVVGLEIGADDYITKPFHVREIIARVRSVLRRSAQDTPPVQAAAHGSANFVFDEMIAIPDHMKLADRSGADCDLTSAEFKLLSVFLNRPKRVLSRDQLMDLIGGHAWNPTDRTIDNQIARLRKKIERDAANPKLIKTVRGVGYTFACEVDVVPTSGS